MSFIWSAVCVNPRGEIIRARSFTREVVITNETTGAEWRQAVPTDFLRYLCVAATETEECAIGVGGDDIAYVVQRGAAVVYRRAHGQDPVAIIPAPGGGFIPYVFVSPRAYLRGLETVSPPELQAEGTSQGFQQVLPDGTVQFRDGHHGIALGGHIIARPVTHDGWTVGQEGDGAIGAFEHATGRYFTPLRGRRVVDGIKFALTPERRLVIAAAVDPGGEYYDTFVPPYRAKDDPPPPPPPPDPEPPMELPDPADVLRVLTIERDKYPAKFEDAPTMNVALGKVLNAVALQFPHMGMHRKDGEKSAPQPITGIGMSRDTLRVLPPGDPLGYWSDVLGATGSLIGSAQAPEWKRSTDDERSFVRPVATTPDPPPPPPPPPSGDLESRVAALERWMARVRA